MRDERLFLAFRKHPGNRFTLPVLLGCLEEKGLSQNFRVVFAQSKEEMDRKVRGKDSLIGYSFMTPDFGQVREEIEWLRAHLSGNPVFLAGGSHPSGDPEGTLRMGFDFVFIGESEKTFPQFLRLFLGGPPPSPDLIQAEQRPSRLLDHPPHSPEHRLFAPIEITRGCLYHCAFCQTPRIFGQTLRHRSPENVVKYLKRSIPAGYRQSKFISPNAFCYGSMGTKGPDLGKLEEFLNACQEAGLEGIHFGCYPSEVRPDWVTPEVLDLVKRYCRNRTVVLGAQTGSDSLLQKLRRGHTAEQALNAARWIRQAGFMPHVDFVFGFPGETLEDRKLSLALIEKMIRELGAKIHAHTYMPLPGTPLFPQDPSPLDAATKNFLTLWEKRKRLDGWWKEQEAVAWKIVKWRDTSLIGGRNSTRFPLES
jgi:B12-binding domain/radical SAM domain protein